MTVYMKSFVFASLVYLGLAVIFGALNGMTDIGYIGTFAHTHFNLLGFMSMIVFGIGYFILPRFNGVDLRFENWVPIHFWMANISLPLMVIFRGLEVDTGESIYTTFFIIMAIVQSISIFMFIINIWLTLTPKKVVEEQSAPSASTTAAAAVPAHNATPDKDTLPQIQILPETPIAELVDRLPEAQQVLIDCGLMALQMPGHIDKVRMMGITIETAANNHSLDLDGMIVKLEQLFQANGYNTDIDIQHLRSPEQNTASAEITTDTLIGDIIATYPAARPIFQKYFGDGCFDCPGQSYESVDLACRMHNIEPREFLTKLKQAIN